MEMKITEVDAVVENKTSYRDYQEQIDDFSRLQDINRMLQAIPSTTNDASIGDYVAVTGVKSNESGKVQAREYFKQWKGRVIEIEDKETFVAKIEAVKEKAEPVKIVRFNSHKVETVNIDQLREGAVFYWTVGLFSNAKGTIRRKSEIRFQLLTPPSPQLVDALKDKFGDIYDGISWME